MTLTLCQYIVEVGDQAAVKAFGVKLRTVQSWRRGERVPRPSQVPRIIAGSGGRVGPSGIYVTGDGCGLNGTAPSAGGEPAQEADPDADRIDPVVEGA